MNDTVKSILEALGILGISIGLPIAITKIQEKRAEKEAIQNEMNKRKTKSYFNNFSGSDFKPILDHFDKSMKTMNNSLTDDKTILLLTFNNIINTVEKYYPDELALKTKDLDPFSKLLDGMFDGDESMRDLYGINKKCNTKIIDGSTLMQKMCIEISKLIKTYKMLLLERAYQIIEKSDKETSEYILKFVYESLLHENTLSKSEVRNLIKQSDELKKSNYSLTISIVQHVKNQIFNIIEKYYPERYSTDKYMIAMCNELRENDIFELESIKRRYNKYIEPKIKDGEFYKYVDESKELDAAKNLLAYFIDECFKIK